MSILVSGAAGGLGRLVTAELVRLGAPNIIATTRDPSQLVHLAAQGVDVRAADFDDPASLATAFAGADRALIISTDSLDGTDRRIHQHRSAIAAAARAGVGHLLYTSIVNPHEGNPAAVARDHRLTEDALAESGLPWTALRNNLYSEVTIMALAPAVASGALYAAAADGAVSYVARADCARAAAAALLAADIAHGPIDITGPEAITRADLAAIAADVTGRPVEYVAVDADAAVQGMIGAGLPEPLARLLVTFDLATASGQFSGVSNAVTELAGAEPESVASFLRANKHALDVV
jgi:NAD(P)H dehydrogenase (quinone)